ncbi:MAG: ATP-binding protein [Treponema sp.]|nr:ATP-binding protein [Treponema sp.]
MRLGTRIFLGTTGLVLGVTAFSWLLSAAFLEPFYTARKRAELERIALAIGPLPADPAASYDRFAVLEQSASVHITVIDAKGGIAYDTGAADYTIVVTDAGRRPPPPGPAPSLPPPPFAIPGLFPPASAGEGARNFLDRLRPGEPTFLESTDPRFGLRILYLVRRQRSGLVLVLSFPLAQVEESARLAALFSVLSGLAALAVGGALSFFFARSVTKPLVQLNALSRSLARLDFSQRFSSTRKDEVAELGLTLNELSASLARALAELESTNARLREDVERERRVDAMRREFISSVSHELKTPIALVLGYAEGLIEGVPQGPEGAREYLAIIVDEAKKMDMQVRDLLELSQLESGLLPLRKESFDLGELAAEVLASFAPTLAERGIGTELRRAPAPVRADRPRVRRAVVEYLSNALSHLDEERRLEVEVAAADGMAELAVFNSGEAIPEGALELIWKSYYRVDSSRSRDFGGTGLGLAIVRGIAARHGGTCGARNLEAAEGRPRGVRFFLRLPSD